MLRVHDDAIDRIIRLGEATAYGGQPVPAEKLPKETRRQRARRRKKARLARLAVAGSMP